MLDIIPTRHRTATLRRRLLAKIEKLPSGCWHWTGYVNSHGYGRIGINGRRVMTHRAAYELFVGPIPEGLQIDHLCRLRSCCNPEHLEAVTPQENTLRSDVTKHRDGFCSRGHERNAANTYYHKNRPGGDCRICKCERERARNAKRRQKGVAA